MTAAPVDSPLGIRNLIEESQTDVEELLAEGEVSRAVELNKRTGIEFEPKSFPMYFTGAFDAPLVLVHLNPKSSPRLSGRRFQNFEAYYEAHRRFGFHHWEQDPSYRSAFDHKQVRFLRPFGVIEFLSVDEPRSRRLNPALAIDQKLQLELVPYASPTFPAHRLTDVPLLRPHFDRVLGAVTAYEREYVLFCGAVFDDLLDRSGRIRSRQDYRFRVPTTRGFSKAEYRFSKLVLEYEGGDLRAGVARSFATQGLPMAQYAKKVRELY